MYSALLITHSLLRWPALLAGLALLVVCWIGFRRGAEFTPGHQRLRQAAVGLMDLQIVLGGGLYFGLSPIVTAARADFGAAMRDAQLRFFGVEHIATMSLALIVMHVGHVRAKRHEGPARHRSLFITQCVWLILVLLAIPWPGLDIARPLLRF